MMDDGGKKKGSAWYDQPWGQCPSRWSVQCHVGYDYVGVRFAGVRQEGAEGVTRDVG